MSNSIPVTFIKLSANVIESHLTNIINKKIDLNCYSEHSNDNTISSVEFSVKNLLKTLERETQIATDWFKGNHMIVNADRF